MEHILLPSKVLLEEGAHASEARLIVEPCYYGYGTTLGNALRRVLLSSLPGASVTAVKIKGVTHEFQAIPHMKEDVLQVILNLKNLRVRLHTEEPVKLTLSVSGEKIVTAKDIEANADVEVINTDLVIATLTDAAASLDMEITIEKGRGFSPTEARPHGGYDLGTIAVDALFSPVTNVSYRVEPTRVGEITDYDRLVLSLETDGTVTPKEAMQEAMKKLKNYVAVVDKAMNGGAEAE